MTSLEAEFVRFKVKEINLISAVSWHYWLQDSEGNVSEDWSTLVYDRNLIDNLKMIIKGRDVKAPYVSIGLDGGKQKVTFIILAWLVDNK